MKYKHSDDVITTGSLKGLISIIGLTAGLGYCVATPKPDVQANMVEPTYQSSVARYDINRAACLVQEIPKDECASKLETIPQTVFDKLKREAANSDNVITEDAARKIFFKYLNK